MSAQDLNAIVEVLPAIDDQILHEKGQENKICSLDSFSELQRRHLGFTLRPQERSRSFVGQRLRERRQVKNICFRTPPRIQTIPVHGREGSGSHRFKKLSVLGGGRSQFPYGQSSDIVASIGIPYLDMFPAAKKARRSPKGDQFEMPQTLLNLLQQWVRQIWLLEEVC